MKLDELSRKVAADWLHAANRPDVNTVAALIDAGFQLHTLLELGLLDYPEAAALESLLKQNRSSTGVPNSDARRVFALFIARLAAAPALAKNVSFPSGPAERYPRGIDPEWARQALRSGAAWLSAGKPKRGRPRDTDAAFDAQLAQLWQGGGFQTIAELAAERDLPPHSVRAALDRHRKRRERAGGG